ncbi:MAG: hypothetical protein LUD39_05955 [Opitutae bacterium]|nr:hypothetical protein [Opitutae bacterium]
MYYRNFNQPLLYFSRYIITRNKGEYYRHIQDVRNKDGNNAEKWEAWILFILKGIEKTAADSIIDLVLAIKDMMNEYKQTLRPLFGKQYRHELINNLFSHPCTKIEYIERDMQVSRVTATKYLEKIVEAGLLTKQKFGPSNYYTNVPLTELLLKVSGKYGSAPKDM